jgi:hypothetical protein
MNKPDVAADEYSTGMSRFLSQANLDRYRILASAALGDTERQHVLDVLAREVRAFRCQAARPPSLPRGLGPAPSRKIAVSKRRLDEQSHA